MAIPMILGNWLLSFHKRHFRELIFRVEISHFGTVLYKVLCTTDRDSSKECAPILFPIFENENFQKNTHFIIISEISMFLKWKWQGGPESKKSLKRETSSLLTLQVYNAPYTTFHRYISCSLMINISLFVLLLHSTEILVYFHVHFTSNSFDLKVWGGGIVVKCVPGVISHAWWLSTICFVTPYCFLSSGVLRLVTRQLFLAITKVTMTTLIGYNSSHDLRVLLLYYMPVMTMIYVEVFWNATSVFIWSQSR